MNIWIAGASVLMYVLFTFACWRIAAFFCVEHKWLLLVPILNIQYFAHMSDVVSVENHETHYSICRYLMGVCLCGFCISALLHFFQQYEIVLLIGRIGVMTFGAFIVLIFFWGYMVILANSFNHPDLVCLASLVIPFPIWLFIASFTIVSKTEEVLELYFGP